MTRYTVVWEELWKQLGSMWTVKRNKTTANPEASNKRSCGDNFELKAHDQLVHLEQQHKCLHTDVNM